LRIIRLTQGADNLPVEAQIVKLTNKHVDDFDSEWLELLRLYEQEDKFWDLTVKPKLISRYENYEGYAVEYQDQTEGLLLIETQEHGSQFTPGKRLIYVNYVATKVIL
jgi:hypothetical protein